MIWRRWVALWDRREPATGLALMRIFIAVCLLGDGLDLWLHDLITPLYSRAGYASLYTGWPHDLLGADPGPALFAILQLAAAALLVGAGTRVACVVIALTTAQLGNIAPDSDRGIDMMLRIVLMILALSQSHAQWSVDAWVWRKLGRPLPTEVPAWPRYLVMLQLVWIYASGGMNKSGAEWGPLGGFRALENIATDPNLARLPAGWLAYVWPLARVATALSIAFELGAPLFLVGYYAADTRERGGRWRRVFVHVRWVWIALGVAFHIGIAILLRIGMFPYGMLALYPVLLRPAELQALGQRLKGLMPANRASSPS